MAKSESFAKGLKRRRKGLEAAMDGDVEKGTKEIRKSQRRTFNKGGGGSKKAPHKKKDRKK